MLQVLHSGDTRVPLSPNVGYSMYSLRTDRKRGPADGDRRTGTRKRTQNLSQYPLLQGPEEVPAIAPRASMEPHGYCTVRCRL